MNPDQGLTQSFIERGKSGFFLKFVIWGGGGGGGGLKIRMYDTNAPLVGIFGMLSLMSVYSSSHLSDVNSPLKFLLFFFSTFVVSVSRVDELLSVLTARPCSIIQVVTGLATKNTFQVL